MIMKKMVFPTVSGAILICLGLIVMLCWYLHLPNLLSILPKHIDMVFNTAFCFTLSGLALCLSQKRLNYQKQIYIIIGAFLLIIAGLTLIEYSLRLSLGIDQLFIHTWHLDQNKYPGRMAVNTSTAFILTGLCFILFPYSHKKFVALLLQVAIFSVMLLGIAALLGYLLKVELLYSWYQYTTMAIHTAIGMILLGSALWTMWSESSNYSNLYHDNLDKKIILLSTMILISIASIACLAGFTIEENPVSEQLEFIILIIAISISIGILLLYWQVLPLVNELILAKQEAIENSDRFRLAFDYSPVGIALVSLEGRWLKINKSLCDIIGYSESELLAMDIKNISHPSDLKEYLSHVKQLSKGKTSFYRMEKRYIRKDKKTTWTLLIGSIVRNDKGMPLYYIEQIQDINDKRKADKELSFKAYYDALTGLVNRDQLAHSLNVSITSALRHQQQFAIFFIDLDHFKKINDTLGHDVGDELLKIIGDRLKNNIRKTEIAARLGGDEFVLILNGANNPETAIIFAEKILDVLTKPIVIKDHELLITASIGISLYPSNGVDYQSLIKSADVALYKAKENGRNSYQFCTQELNNDIQDKILCKNALQVAIKNQEFYLTYLPKININNRIIGFETLLRWNNPQHGNISPSKIIPLAEEIGIINQLSDWIIYTASEQTLQWINTFELPLKITINIAEKHYFQPDFANKMRSILGIINLPLDHFLLEINENLIMQDPDYSVTIINTLKDHNIQIIIDNFGTGYSSLKYLNRFKVNYIKISREFVKNITTNQEHRQLVTAIVALSKSLNIKVITEGIESVEQYNLLLQLECDEFQGYYISQPLTKEMVPSFLERYRSAITS